MDKPNNYESNPHPLYEILLLLDSANIHYHLGRYQEDTVTIHISVVGGRHEIDVKASGEVLTSFFNGNEDLFNGIEVIRQLIEQQELSLEELEQIISEDDD